MKLANLRNKLASQRGESIVETLMAVLVSAISLLLLATVLSVSFKMVTTSRTTMNNYYSADAKLAQRSGSASSTGTVNITGTGLDTGVSTPVNYYVNDKVSNSTVVSYEAR